MSKYFFKKILRLFGFDLRRYSPSSSEDAQFLAMLKTHRVDLIFDVGANTGQFGRHIRTAGYGGRIVSFEPMSAARSALLAASEHDSRWEVAPQAAIGDEDGEIDIHLAGNSVSSSVLKMLEAHSDAAPDSAYVGSERVPVRRLDGMAAEYFRDSASPFLKIDTQGYEDRVLNGAAGILDKFVGLQLELSLVPLYEDQRLFEDMVRRLLDMGFDLWSLQPAFVDQQSGRILQMDATFFRR